MINDKRVKELLKKRGKLLGEGSYGSVYDLDRNSILKISSPCSLQTKSSNQNCIDIKRQPWIEETKNDKGEKKRFIPNAFIENYIGYNYTNNLPCFTKIREYYIYNNSAYAVQEKISPVIEDVLTDFQKLSKYLFSLCYFVCYAQEKIKFNHYDLHIGNIGYVECDKVVSFSLPEYVDVRGNKFAQREIKIHLEYEPRILDLGYSRCESEGVEIRAKNSDQIPSYSEFNQFYDLPMLFGSIYYEDKKGSVPIVKVLEERNFELLMRKIWGYDFSDKITLNKIYKKYYFNNVRPENPTCVKHCDPYSVLYILSSWLKLSREEPDEKYSLNKFKIRRDLFIAENKDSDMIEIDRFKSYCCGIPIVKEKKKKIVVGYGVRNKMGYADYSKVSRKIFNKYYRKLVVEKHKITLSESLDENVAGPLFIENNKLIFKERYENVMITYLVCCNTKEGEEYYIGYSSEAIKDIAKELLEVVDVKYAICLYEDEVYPSIAYEKRSYGQDNREGMAYPYILVASRK